MLNAAQHLDPDRFRVFALYLRRPGQDLGAFRNAFSEAGAEYAEFEGGSRFDFTQFRQVLETVRRWRPDIIHCHEDRTDLYGYLVMHLEKRPRVVTTLHGVLIPVSRRSRKLYWLQKHVGPFLMRRLHSVIVVSEFMGRHARAMGVPVDRIVENGIDVDAWDPALPARASPPICKPEGRRWIGFVGRISPEKGSSEFVRIAARLSGRHPDLEFVVAGQGEALPSMRDLAAQLRLEQRINFLGHVGKPALHGLYKQLDVLLSPSRTEGLPNNLLEACAMQVPIVATRVGGVPEIIAHGCNGLLADPGDLRALAGAVESLLDDALLAGELGRSGRDAVVERYSVRAHVAKMSRYYLDVMGLS
jgi:glycosyltransferase involved in cell wall biosynthesis